MSAPPLLERLPNLVRLHGARGTAATPRSKKKSRQTYARILIPRENRDIQYRVNFFIFCDNMLAHYRVELLSNACPGCQFHIGLKASWHLRYKWCVAR